MDMSLLIPIAMGAFSLLCLIIVLLTSNEKTSASTEAMSSVLHSGSNSNHSNGSFDTSQSGLINKPPKRQESNERLRERLVQAGLYKRNTKAIFYFMQFIFAVIPFGVGFVAYTMGLLSIRYAVFMAVTTGIAGIVTPGLWLDFRKSVRQTTLRRALPDALDVITVCVGAGLSLTSAIVRVSNELVTAHPMLANEMTIVHREIQMGKSTGEALKHLAQRFDIEELRSLASVVEQSEKFGASISAALKVYADSLRVQRIQMAQSRAQRAAVKLLFPTVICIFPALLVVILGPAAFEIFQTMNDINK